ncbi:MAG: SDR family oxidoreductase [Bacteroidota bacterium]
MQIAIIGCGWLGFPLAKHLIQQGHQVKGSTTTAEKLPLLRQAGITAQHLVLGIEKNEDLPAFLKNCALLIINIPPGRRDSKVEERHPKQIQNLLQAATLAGVRHVIFISSTGVYGNENRVVTEAEATKPERASGKALVAIEAYLNELKPIQSTVLRLAGLVGGKRKAGHFLAAKKNVTNGSAPVNMVHREDCIQVITEIIKQDKWGETYNVCADEHPTRHDFYIHQAQKQGLEPPTFVPNIEPSFKIVSNEKLKRHLNYQLVYPDPMQF